MKHVLILVLLLMPTVLFGAVEIQNSLIRFATDIVGNFRLWTTGGDPNRTTDDNQSLLNNDAFGTSYVLVSVDGRTARYGSRVGKAVTFSKRSGNDLLSSWEFRGIHFEQKLSLYRSAYSTVSNLMRVEIKIRNQDTRSHSVGVRIVLDAMPGNASGEGFYLPGRGLVQNGIRIETGVPSLVLAGGRSAKGPPMVEINLYGKDLVTPDEMLLTHTRYLNDATLVPILDGAFTESLSGKSALSMVWKEKTFAAGSADGIAIAVGAATAKTREEQPVHMVMAFPQSPVEDEDIWLGVILGNENQFWDINRTMVTLEYDSDKLALDGTPATVVLGKIDRWGSGFCSWKLRPLKGGSAKVTVRVTALYRSMPLRFQYIHTIAVGNR